MRYSASIIAALTLTTVHDLCGNRPLATVYAQAKVADSNGEGGETPYVCSKGYGTVVCNPGQKANSNTRHGPRLIDGIMYCSTTYQCCPRG
ncbi:hypothetical protein HBI88_226880 [Parastagonospora nodorum]|nr:hypothetical protein HBH95_022810 [Parastagonospora nodorum]KAH5711732.1 hypothetical protein HBI20_170730 [Parastagonospora nodorum]KAH5769389.1 hypothetical protein HBI97_163120 [Parastagonospora nodorum]KAH5801151.1 hypothetical protein HBI96_148330 [Parastagonospora nodorum]KAH5815459.1 hypothetical protein HBI94_127830 [Parastagonospora nodorum]